MKDYYKRINVVEDRGRRGARICRFVKNVEESMSPGFHAFVVGAQFSTLRSSATATAVVDVRPARQLVTGRSGALSTVFRLLNGGAIQPRAGRTADLRSIHDAIASDADDWERHETGRTGVDSTGPGEDGDGLGDGEAW